jgi:A/G-specific adenine glycosylase
MTAEAARAAAIAPALIGWHARAGRHDLPWQRERSRYRVWISEIMLQQTQVRTVVPYFERFVARFPDVAALAEAPLDEVLRLWSGLGYYARARNLHRAARRVRDESGGELPGRREALESLPGIGRSTAGAILALADGARHPILDGNVKRVLARVFAVDGSPAASAVIARLWALADAATPGEQVGAYTQAIMDLGATVCVRRRPLCAACPLEALCIARHTGRQEELPAPKRRARVRRVREVVMLVMRREDGAVLLERRPESGLWGGLWSFPEFHGADAARAYAGDHLRAARVHDGGLVPLRHAFTHFELVITPLVADGVAIARVEDDARCAWLDPSAPSLPGVPVPVRRILDAMV